MISVVVPTLNEERLLPGCLESLRHQDYDGEYEVVIADNGSTDRTLDIARHAGVRIVSCGQKQSVFHARRSGAAAARGDLIVQADADTLYPRDWLAKLAGRLARHPEAVAVTGRFLYRDPPLWAQAEYSLRNAINRLTTALSGTPLLVSGATFAFRRAAFLSAGGYDGIEYSVDQYGIASRLSRTGKVIYDKGIFVLTSSRSVRKPIYVILKDVLAHFGRLLMHLAKANLGRLKLRLPRTRSGQIGAGTLGVGMVFVLIAVYGYVAPGSSVFGKVYEKGDTSEKVVALTFDDGPNDPYTSAIIDTLDRYHIKATFFAVGKNVELCPGTAKRIVAEGHVLADHSYTHDANHALTTSGSKDIERAQLAISRVASVVPHLYRPPHGKKTPWEMMRVEELGMIEVTWNVSANDQHLLAYFGKPSPGKYAGDIVRSTRPGGIILLHDGYGTDHNTPDSDKSLTVQALPLIIEQLQAKGYRFVTVPELLGVSAYNN
jgi:peptidoglycan-N-acetylglucosamine deacetylase